MKKLKFILIFVIISIFLCGCVGYYARTYHPANFPDTIWATEDDVVVIEINNQIYKRGYISVNGETHQLFFNLNITHLQVAVYTNEEIKSDHPTGTENWTIDFNLSGDGKMVVEIKESKYFKVGDTLTFYNKGANTKNDNYISENKAEELAQKHLPQKDFEQHIRYNHIEKIDGVDYHVLYAFAQNLQTTKIDNSTTQSVEEVKTCWMYLDATTGELYKLEELEHNEIIPPTFE